MNIAELEARARRIRLEALEYTIRGKMGHLGGTYSCVELLVALYYGGFMRVDAKRPDWAERDRLILSKGHACLALFPILVDLGFMPRSRLDTYGQDGGLGGQVDVGIPGVDWNTGSLGHALGVGAGMALAARLDKKDFRAYVILGDAEVAEGSVWEAVAFASDLSLSNLVCIIDRNRLSVTEVMEDDSIFRSFRAKLESFGWACREIDGHSFPAIAAALGEARVAPTMILANTIKGKGVSFMEGVVRWHHGVPTAKELEIARRELGSP